MKVFVAGATGAIGRFLVPALIEAGHEVAGMTRRAEKAAWLESVGATPVVCDVFDAGLAGAVADFAPHAVVHQLTDLPQAQAKIALKVRGLNRIRMAGTDALTAAAHAAGVERFLAQSVAFGAQAPVRKGVTHLEAATLAYPGVVLRYGYFYGPGTWYPQGTERTPKVSVQEAAARSVGLLEAEPGVYEIVESTYP